MMLTDIRVVGRPAAEGGLIFQATPRIEDFLRRQGLPAAPE
jgi:hypothetical protein